MYQALHDQCCCDLCSRNPVEKAAAVSVTDTILHSGDGGFLSDHYYHWTVCDNGIQYDGEYDAFHRRQSDTSVFSNHSIHSQRGS